MCAARRFKHTKRRLGWVVPAALGFLISDVSSHGIGGIRWAGVAAAVAVVFLVTLLLPDRFFEKKKTGQL